MRNTSKMTTLENKFPRLAVEHGCIISKDADITVAFEVELPEMGIIDRLHVIGGNEVTIAAFLDNVLTHHFTLFQRCV